MIKWSDIENECGNYKEGFVNTFLKYEGMETDERDGSNRVVKVTKTNFADHMGIPVTTFYRWVEVITTGASTSSKAQHGSSISARVEEAASKARLEAEAAAQTRLAEALERQRVEAERARQAALVNAQREKAQAVEAERLRVEAEAHQQAEEAAKLKLQEIEARIRAEIKAEPPTAEVLAEMAKQALTSEDPDIVNKMAEAYGKHRVEQDARNKADAAARAAAARAANAERDAQNATRRASLEYEDSALKLFMDAHEMLTDANALLSRKPITFSNVVASGLTEGEILDKVEEVVEISRRIEANVMDATLTTIL